MAKPKPSESTPGRRKSIHREEKDGEKPVDEKDSFVRCKRCSNIYRIVAGKFQVQMSEEDVEKWLKGEENKSNLYPNLYEEIPFECENCSEGPGSQKPFLESKRNRKNMQSPKKPQTSGTIGWILITLSIIISFGAVILYYGYDYYKSLDKSFDVNLEELSDWDIFLEQRIYGLENTYKRQGEEVWYSLVAGIKSVVRNKPNQPSVFLFLYDNKLAEETARCLAKDASDPAIRYLMHFEKKPLMYTGADFNTKRLLEDSGRLLVDLNNTVRDTGAMILTKLQDVPPEVAKSLHFVCDAYSPLVEKAVYFFTLEVDKVPAKKLPQAAGNKLNDLWSEKIPDSSIDALITRITSNVIGITNDNIKC